MGMLGKLLPQLVVLSLPLLLLVQLSVPDLDDGLEVLPGVLQGFHSKPSVGVRGNVEPEKSHTKFGRRPPNSLK